MRRTTSKSTLKSEKPRRDYDFNHAKITEAFYGCVQKNKRFPSNTDLATLTGLSEKTVRNHLKSFDLSPITDQVKLFAETIMLGLVQRIHRTGDPSAVKLYLQIAFQWNEKGTERKAFNDTEDLSELSDAEILDRVTEVLDENGVNLLEIWRDRNSKLGKKFAERDEYIRLNPDATGLVIRDEK